MEDHLFSGDPIKCTLLTSNIVEKITCTVLFKKKMFVTTMITNLELSQDFSSIIWPLFSSFLFFEQIGLLP